MGYTLIEEGPAPSPKRGGFTLLEDMPEEAKPYDVPAGVKSAMNVVNGATFGFGDELAGLLPGVDKERYRATVDDFRKEYPGSALLGTISGNMLVPFGSAKLAATMNPYALAATVGGAGGLLQGAGDAKALSDVPKEATQAGALGMIGGPLVMGAGTTGGNVMAALLKPAASRLPGVGDTLSFWLARNQVARALDRDSIDAGNLPAIAQGLGSEARLVDTGGKNTNALLDINAVLPGKTGDKLNAAIDERQIGRADRLTPIVQAMNNGQGRAGALYSQWQKQKLDSSAPLYAQFEQSPIIADQTLQNLMNTADRQGFFKPAASLADLEGKAPFSLVSGKTPGGTYDARELNYVKQAIDDRINQAVNKGDNNLVRALVDYKNRFVDSLDTLSGGKYKPALDAYAGPASMQSALDIGRKAATMSAEEISDAMAGMSNSEKEAFRVGAAEAFRTKFGAQSGQTEYLNIAKNRNAQERLQAIFGDQAKYDDAIKLLGNEAKLKRMERLGRGSQTAGREAEAEDQTMNVAQDLVGMVGSAKAGSFPALINGIGKYSSRLGTPEPVRNAIGEILLNRDFARQAAELMSAQRALKDRATANALLSGVVAERAVPSR